MLKIKSPYIILFFIALVILTGLLLSCGGGGGDGGEGSDTRGGPIDSSHQDGQITSNNVTVRFTIPSQWTISQPDGSGAGLYSTTSASLISAGSLTTAPDITVNIFSNGSNLSLSDFVQNYGNGWFAIYNEKVNTTINGYPAIVVNDTAAPIPHTPELAAFILKDQMVVLIRGHQGVQQEFYQTLNSIAF